MEHREWGGDFRGTERPLKLDKMWGARRNGKGVGEFSNADPENLTRF